MANVTGVMIAGIVDGDTYFVAVHTDLDDGNLYADYTTDISPVDFSIDEDGNLIVTI